MAAAELLHTHCGKTLVDRKLAKEVARGFYEAAAHGLKEEAFSYCTEDVSEYCVRSLLEYQWSHKPSGQTDALNIETVHSGDGKAVLLLFYADLCLQNYRAPNRIVRLVLEQPDLEWKVKYINNFGSKLPTRIIFGPQVEVSAAEVFSLWPKYILEMKEPNYIRMICTDAEDQFISRFDIVCSRIELGDMLPGVNICFYNSGNQEKVGMFESSWAQSVEVYKGQGYFEINVILNK